MNKESIHVTGDVYQLCSIPQTGHHDKYFSPRVGHTGAGERQAVIKKQKPLKYAAVKEKTTKECNTNVL